MRVRARVTGVVQGVGFRPYVYGLATELRLSGFVLNDADGVLLEVEGSAVDAFLGRLADEAPPLAAIESVSVERLPTTGEAGFTIRSSVGWRSPGELAISSSTSAVAVCRSSASLSCWLRSCRSWNSRVFSIAMTAWLAKVSSNRTC